MLDKIEASRHELQEGLEDIEEILSKQDIGYDELVDESSEGGWFDENGWLLKPIPSDCIKDCSGSGRKDDQVEYWTEELGFDKGLPREKAEAFLREFGAWEADELAMKTDTELAQMILWEFCNELRDQAYEISDEDLEDHGLPIDIGEWEDADWTLFQKELGMVSLNH